MHESLKRVKKGGGGVGFQKETKNGKQKFFEMLKKKEILRDEKAGNQKQVKSSSSV